MFAMFLNVFCFGAYRLSASPHRGALLPVFIFCLSHLPLVHSVTCTNCMDTIVGCKGGSDCPTIIDLMANKKVFEANKLGTVPIVKNLLPPELVNIFTRSVTEAIVGIASAPTSGSSIDFSDGAYVKASAVVQAAIFGHCTIDEASVELSNRLEVADHANTIAKINGAIDLLKSKADTLYAGSHGVYTFIWAKVTQLFSSSRSVKLLVEKKTKAAELVASLDRPQTAEQFLRW